jgi:outer membrane receptor protein involved in Fe transport
MRIQYSRINLDLVNKPGSLGGATTGAAGNSPENQFAVHSFVDLPHDLSLYAGLRYVDELPSQLVDDYTAVDISLRWQITERLLTSITVRNLNDRRQMEISSGGANMLERGALVRASWSF